MTNFRPSSSVNFTGSIAGSPAGIVASNATSAFTGTVNYRNSSAPGGSTAFGTISPVYTSDGNVVVNVPYTYSPGTPAADFLLVYYREGGGAAVSPGNPAVSTNPSSGSIDFTLKPSTTYSFGIQQVRRTENGLSGTAITSSADTNLTGGNYTGTVYNTSAELLSQRPVFEAYGPATFDFSSSTEGFTGVNANISSTSSTLIVSPTTTNPYIRKLNLNFPGGTYQIVRARVRRLGGSGSWEGTVYYRTSPGHGESGTYIKTVSAPSNLDDWNIVEWDMATSTSPSDWLNSTISGLRFDFSSVATSNWEVDWVSVGKVGVPTNGAVPGVNLLTPIGSPITNAAEGSPGIYMGKSVIKIYDASGVLRVKLGNLSA